MVVDAVSAVVSLGCCENFPTSALELASRERGSEGGAEGRERGKQTECQTERERERGAERERERGRKKERGEGGREPHFVCLRFSLFAQCALVYFIYKMQVVKDGASFHLNQAKYVRRMLKRFNMAESSSVSAPMVDTECLFAVGLEVEEHAPYRAASGSLMWLALCTRPDLLFPTILLSRFKQQPKQPPPVAVDSVKHFRGSALPHRRSTLLPMEIEK